MVICMRIKYKNQNNRPIRPLHGRPSWCVSDWQVQNREPSYMPMIKPFMISMLWSAQDAKRTFRPGGLFWFARVKKQELLYTHP